MNNEIELTTAPEQIITTTVEPSTSSDNPKADSGVVFNFDSTTKRGHSIALSLAGDTGEELSINNANSGQQTVEEVEHRQRLIVLYVTNTAIDYTGKTSITINYGRNQGLSLTFSINWSPDYLTTDYGFFKFLNDEEVYMNGSDTSYPLSWISYDCSGPSLSADSNVAQISDEVGDYVFDVIVKNNENGPSIKKFKITGLSYSAVPNSKASFTSSINFTQYNYTSFYLRPDEFEVEYASNAFLLASIPATQTLYTFTFTSNSSVVWCPPTPRENCAVNVLYNSDARAGTVNVIFPDENTSGIRTASFRLNVGDRGDFYSFEVRQNKVLSDGYITVNTNNTVIPYNDVQEHSINFTATNCIDGTFSASANSEWIKINSLKINNGSGLVMYSLKQNERNEERKGSISITAKSVGGAYTSTSAQIIQLSTLTPIDFPLWKDVDVELNDDNPKGKYISYNISYNGEVIYNGRAFKINNKAPKIRVNDILRSFINESIDLSKTFQVQSNNSHYTFILNVQNNDGLYYPIKQLRVFNDNSYINKDNYKSGFISEYINNQLDRRQLFIVSAEDFADNEESQLGIHGWWYSPGLIYTDAVNINNDVASYVLPLNIFHDVLSITFNKDEDVRAFNVVDTCKPFAVYWRNIYGGYNSCLFNDASKQTDSINSSDIQLQNNNTSLSFAKKHYKKEITEKWSIKTDYLNDSQASIIKYLPHSPEVYLHDLVNDRIVPVLITDAQVEHKNYRNNSRKFITYSFTLENSNTKIIQ